MFRSHSSESVYRRHNINTEKIYHPVNSENPQHEFVNEDCMFSKLGEPWDLFKNKDYKLAFKPIYTLACTKNPIAEYLIGEFCENGLGEISKSPKDAADFYSRAVIDSSTQEFCDLRRKAENSLKRIIKQIKFS